MDDFERFLESVFRFATALLDLLISVFYLFKWLVYVSYPFWVQISINVIFLSHAAYNYLIHQPLNIRIIIIVGVGLLVFYRCIYRRVRRFYKFVRRLAYTVLSNLYSICNFIVDKLIKTIIILKRLIVFLFPLLVISTILRFYLPSNCYRLFQNFLITFIPVYHSGSVITSYYMFLRDEKQLPSNKLTFYNQIYSSVKTRFFTPKRPVHTSIKNTPKTSTVMTRKQLNSRRRLEKDSAISTKQSRKSTSPDLKANLAIMPSGKLNNSIRWMLCYLLTSNFDELIDIWLSYWIITILIDWLFYIPLSVLKPCQITFKYGIVDKLCYTKAIYGSYRAMGFSSLLYLYNLIYNVILIIIMTQPKENLLNLRNRLQKYLEYCIRLLMGFSPILFGNNLCKINESNGILQNLWDLFQLYLPKYGVLIINCLIYSPQILLSFFLPKIFIRMYIFVTRFVYPIYSSSYYLENKSTSHQIYWLTYFVLNFIFEMYFLYWLKNFSVLYKFFANQFDLIVVWLIQFLSKSPSFLTKHLKAIEEKKFPVIKVSESISNSPLVYYISSDEEGKTPIPYQTYPVKT